MDSERLPGKVLLDITNGKKVIEFLIKQLETSNLKQKIVAIPNETTDDILFNFLNNLNSRNCFNIFWKNYGHDKRS